MLGAVSLSLSKAGVFGKGVFSRKARLRQAQADSKKIKDLCIINLTLSISAMEFFFRKEIWRFYFDTICEVVAAQGFC